MSRKKRSKKSSPPAEGEAPEVQAEETPQEGVDSVELAGAVDGAAADEVPFAEDPAPVGEPAAESAEEETVEMSVDELLPAEEAAEGSEEEAAPADATVSGTEEAPGDNTVGAEAGDEGSPRHALKRVIEAILFASQKPVSAKELISVLKGAADADKENPSAPTRAFAKVKEPVIQAAIEELEIECVEASRAYEVRETAAGWQLVTKPDYSPWLRQLYPENRPARLSAPALETLAIIAYRQPITRADIEAVRGVAVDGVMQTLLDRGLIKIAGRADIPGRPLLYDTTQHFMEHFGLKDLDDLPNATELRKIALPTAEVPEETASAPAAEAEPAAEAHHDFMEEAASEPEPPGSDGGTGEKSAEPEEAAPADDVPTESADTEPVPGEEPTDVLPETTGQPDGAGETSAEAGEESPDNPEQTGVESERSEP